MKSASYFKVHISDPFPALRARVPWGLGGYPAFFGATEYSNKARVNKAIAEVLRSHEVRLPH